MHVGSVIKKYFNTNNDIRTTYNIADNNATCQGVSEEVRAKLLQKSDPYERGETLVCMP